jgi:hypothetical protein
MNCCANFGEPIAFDARAIELIQRVCVNTCTAVHSL